jgi:hypothetical protein
MIVWLQVWIGSQCKIYCILLHFFFLLTSATHTHTLSLPTSSQKARRNFSNAESEAVFDYVMKFGQQWETILANDAKGSRVLQRRTPEQIAVHYHENTETVEISLVRSIHVLQQHTPTRHTLTLFICFSANFSLSL